MLNNTQSIRRWMKANAASFEDPRTGEVDLTAMVEAWDAEEGTGAETLDCDHQAWEIAAEFA